MTDKFKAVFFSFLNCVETNTPAAVVVEWRATADHIERSIKDDKISRTPAVPVRGFSSLPTNLREITFPKNTALNALCCRVE